MIYIVEDDEEIRGIVTYALNSGGFEAKGFESGEEFFGAVESALPELILLDIMLPGEDGLEILRRIREGARTKKLPVIMLTAKNSEYDKVRGLDMGADDYIAKPFGVMELISRVNAVLRRGPEKEKDDDTLEVSGITLNFARREVFCSAGGNAVILTYKEFELLHYLMQNAGRVLSRDRLLETVWGYDFEGESRTVDMHIKSLRQKLGESGALIKTVRGVGYMMVKIQ